MDSGGNDREVTIKSTADMEGRHALHVLIRGMPNAISLIVFVLDIAM
jgi:hypothetical protein